MSGSAFAQSAIGGAGGAGGPRGGGGTGGLDVATGPGQAGSTSFYVGSGGGGGAGVTGGQGGNSGGTGTGGGTGGIAGSNGGAGGNATAPGAGGGGGAHGYVGATVPGALATGGAGGKGADGSLGPQSDAGGGGAGGWGAVITGTGALGALGAGNTISGGAGGAGGNGVSYVSGGNGGAGGLGLSLTGATPILTIDAATSGGTGGAGGTASGGSGSNGDGGAGGAGITGGAASLTITSTVAGGQGGAGGNNAQFEGQGSGGAGGIGVALTGGSLTNQGTITGGNGGAGGSGGTGKGPGAGGVGIYGSGLTILNSGTISGGMSGDGVTQANALEFTGGSNVLTTNGGTLNGGIAIDAGTLTLDQTAADGATGSASYSNVISGGGALSVKTDSSTSVTLSGANTYTGGTTISSGKLVVGNDRALGTGTVTLDGGTLQAAANLISLQNDIAINTSGGTIDAAAGASPSLFGSISDGNGTGGTLKITSSQNGLVFLDGASGTATYTGQTIIGDGVNNLHVFAENQNNLSANSAYTVNANANLLLARDETIGSLAGAGSVSANPGVGTSTLTTGGDNTSTTFSGTLTAASGTLALTKTGTGTFTLSGTNTYTGTTTINGGTLKGGATNAFSAASVVAVNTGGTLDLGGFNQTIGGLSGTGGTVSIGAATLNVDVASATLNNFGGTITGTGTFEKSGAGTEIFGTAGVATIALGPGALIDVQGGTLVGSTSGHADWSQNQASLNIASGATFNGVEGAIQVDALTGAGTLEGGFYNSGSITIGVANGSGTFSGTIADNPNPAGSQLTLSKTGNGTETLAGTSTYTGTTTIYGGTLKGGATNAFSAASVVSVSMGGTLDLGGFGQTIGGLSGTGGTVSIGAATLNVNVASGTTDYFGGTITGTGTFEKSGAGTEVFGTAGVATIALGKGALIDVQGGTLAGSAFGNADWSQNQASLNIASGATFNGVEGAIQVDALIGAGTLEGGYPGSGSITIGVANGSGTFSGTIADNPNPAGSQLVLIKTGTGTETLSGANTYTGATTIDGGTLLAGAANTFSAASTTTVNSGGTLDLGTYAQTIDTVNLAGGTIQNGALTSKNGISSSGGTITNIIGTPALTTTGGTTYLTHTNAFGTVTNVAGATIINDGVTSDDLSNAGTFTNNRSYTANVATNSGTLNNAAGATWTGNVASSTGTLINVGTWTGTIATSGTFDNQAAGTVSGLVTVSGGLTNNDASLNGGALVSGGTLTGAGTISTLQVNAGGTFAPGFSAPGFFTPGTFMIITGDLTLASGSTYAVSVDPTSSTYAQVNGTANLGGTLSATFAPGTYLTKSYDVLHAGSVSGTFASLVDTNLPASFGTHLSYGPNDVYLNLLAQLGIGAGLNTNQQNVAGAINSYFNNGGQLPQGFLNLFYLGNAGQAQALSQLSGEATTGAQTSAFGLMNGFLSLLTDPFGAGHVGATQPAAPLAYADTPGVLPKNVRRAYAEAIHDPAPMARWTVWGNVSGSADHIGGNAGIGSSSVNGDQAALTAGAEYHVSPNVRFGFALSGAGSKWSLGNGLGHGHDDAFAAGLYGVGHGEHAYVSGAFAFAQNWYGMNRTALGAPLSADFQAPQIGARLEAGYRLDTGLIGITPYGALQGQNLDLPSVTEKDPTGSGFGLAYRSRTASETRGELGLRFDRAMVLGEGRAFTLRAKLAWGHEWGGDPRLTAAFASLPGTSFSVTGALPARDAALTSLEADWEFRPGMVLGATFDGAFASHSDSLGGKAELRVSW